jgi:hypothetical protein
MRGSQNSIGGSSQLSTEIHKREDGKFEATSPSMPWAKPVVANTVNEACQALRSVYEHWVWDTCRNGERPV